MSHYDPTSEYDYEPVRGLPYALKSGEAILWQGSPDWRSAARHLSHVASVTLYFAILMAWRLIVTASDGRPATDALETIAWLAALAGLSVTFLGVFALFMGRTTVYTITSRRIVLRYGIAFTKAVNIPFGNIQSAAVRPHANGTGDIALTLTAGSKLAYLILWPHVRPWRISQPEPMFRAIPEPQRVAEILKTALVSAGVRDINDGTTDEANGNGNGIERTQSGREQVAAAA